MKTGIFNKIVCASMLLCMVSCGDATDLLQVSTNIPMPVSTGSCADAKYLDEARAWDVNAYGTPYEYVGRIELTASGNYMFLPDMSSCVFEDMNDGMFESPRREANTRQDVMTNRKLSSPFRKSAKDSARETRVYGNSYPMGTFTKVGDNEYSLSGLGRLIVNEDGTLTLTEGSENYDFSATPVASYELDALTRRFSRTWEVVEVERAYYNTDNKLTGKRKLSMDEIQDEYQRAVVVTQFGAFVRYEWNGDIDGYGLWRWEIPEKQIFQFVFTNTGSYGDAGLEQVYFYDDFAMFVQYAEEYDEATEKYIEVVDVLKTKSVMDFSL